jgi:hypothetical protein
MILRELKQGCPFLYKPNGELFMMEEDGDVEICLTGKNQGVIELWPDRNVVVYPVDITITYKI